MSVSVVSPAVVPAKFNRTPISTTHHARKRRPIAGQGFASLLDRWMRGRLVGVSLINPIANAVQRRGEVIHRTGSLRRCECVTDDMRRNKKKRPMVRSIGFMIVIMIVIIVRWLRRQSKVPMRLVNQWRFPNDLAVSIGQMSFQRFIRLHFIMPVHRGNRQWQHQPTRQPNDHASRRKAT